MHLHIKFIIILKISTFFSKNDTLIFAIEDTYYLF